MNISKVVTERVWRKVLWAALKEALERRLRETAAGLRGMDWRQVQQAALKTLLLTVAGTVVVALTSYVPAIIWLEMRNYLREHGEEWRTALQLAGLALTGAAAAFFAVGRPRLTWYAGLRSALKWLTGAAFIPAAVYPLWELDYHHLVPTWVLASVAVSLISGLLPDDANLSDKGRRRIHYHEDWADATVRWALGLVLAWSLSFLPGINHVFDDWFQWLMDVSADPGPIGALAVPVVTIWLAALAVGIWKLIRNLPVPVSTLWRHLRSQPTAPRNSELLREAGTFLQNLWRAAWKAVADAFYIIMALYLASSPIETYLDPAGWWVMALTCVALGNPVWREQRSGRAVSLLSDEPVADPDEDKLSRKLLAKALCLAVDRAPAEHAFVIGVYGGWGSGKTSVMKMAQTMAAKDGHPTIWLRTWLYESQEKIADAFMQDLTATLRKNGLARLPWGALQRYFTAVKGLLEERVATAIPWKALQTLFSALPGNAELDRSKESINRLIEKLTAPDRKLVVFIDDLDRCSTESVLGTLGFLKEIVDFRRAVFVIGVDHEAVAAALGKRFGKRGAEALHKVIHTTFILDAPSDKHMVDLYRGELGRILGLKGKRVDDMLTQVVWVTGPNPRPIKQLLNALSAQRDLILHAAIMRKIKPETAVYRELLRLKNPAAFARLLAMLDESTRDLLTGTWEQSPDDTGVTRRQRAVELLRLQDVPEDDITHFLILLQAMLSHAGSNVDYVMAFLEGQDSVPETPAHLADWLMPIWNEDKKVADVLPSMRWQERIRLLQGLVTWMRYCLEHSSGALEEPPMMADMGLFRKVLLEWAEAEPWPFLKDRALLIRAAQADALYGQDAQPITFSLMLADQEKVEWAELLRPVEHATYSEEDLIHSFSALIARQCSTWEIEHMESPTLRSLIGLEAGEHILLEAVYRLTLVEKGDGRGIILCNLKFLAAYWRKRLEASPPEPVQKRWMALVEGGLLSYAAEAAGKRLTQSPLPGEFDAEWQWLRTWRPAESSTD